MKTSKEWANIQYSSKLPSHHPCPPNDAKVSFMCRWGWAPPTPAVTSQQFCCAWAPKGKTKKKGEKREKLSRFSKFYASNSTRVVGVWSTLIWFRVCIKRLKSDLLKSVHECEGLLKRLWVYTDIYSYVELLDASRGADQQESRKAHKIDGFDWKTSPNIRAINWSTIHAWLKWTQNVCNQKANLDVVVVRALPGARRRNISSIRGLAWLPLSLSPSLSTRNEHSSSVYIQLNGRDKHYHTNKLTLHIKNAASDL